MDNKNLKEFIQRVQEEGLLVTYDTAAVKQGIILPLLSSLGWNIFDVNEVCPQYMLRMFDEHDKPVGDYALRHNGTNKVLIKVKKGCASLHTMDREIISDHSFFGFDLAVVTNGKTWRFYPSIQSAWEQSRCYTIDIIQRSTSHVAQQLRKLLSKDRVISGKAMSKAEALSQEQYKDFEQSLSEAWQLIFEGPDETLLQLLARKTEEICGYIPDDQTVADFLAEKFQGEQEKISEDQEASEGAPVGYYEDYNAKSIQSYTLLGMKHDVQSWRQLWRDVVNTVIKLNKENRHDILRIRTPARTYFSESPFDLDSPKLIESTSMKIYMETNLCANHIVKLLQLLLGLLGYKDTDLKLRVT